MTESGKRIDVVFFDAGSGHRSAAQALVGALSLARPDFKVRAVDLVDLIAGNERFTWYVKRGIRWFNDELKKEQMFDLRGKVNLSLLVHRFLSEQGIREIAQFWSGAVPDAVVSVTPMYNPAIYRAARLQNPKVACITIPVDFEEFKKHYWFTPGTEQHYFNATERLMEQAMARGVPEKNIYKLSGMLADPRLYKDIDMDRPAELEALGLDADAPTLLVHFGGQGSTILLEIARSLSESPRKPNAIFLCGKSAEVAARISALSTPYKKVALGYLPDTPIKYQQLADVIVGKPGTQTITEALIARRALLLLASTGMRPVQRGNEEWVRAHSAGVIAKHPGEVPRALEELLISPIYKQQAGKSRHRGVFDAADRICELLLNA